MFPTDYIARSPRQALRDYVLHPKPTPDTLALEPLEDGVSSAAKLLASRNEPTNTGCLSDDKSSQPGREPTAAARKLLAKHLGGKTLRFHHDPDLLEELYESLGSCLVPEDDEAAKIALADFNHIARLHDSRQFPPIRPERGHGAPDIPPIKTYKDREQYNARQTIMNPLPALGGELGLTNLFANSVCALANHFVNTPGLLKNEKHWIRNFTTSPLIGSGTADLIGVQVSPSAGLPGGCIRPVFFVHEPFLSTHDLVRFMLVLRSGKLDLFYVGEESQWPPGKYEGRDLLSPAMKLVLLRAIEQMQVNRACYCILGTWDYYLVFELNGDREIFCSDIIMRDPTDSDKLFRTPVTLEKTQLDTYAYKAAVFAIKPSARHLLEVLVSLMVQKRADGPRDDLWWDKDNSVVEKVFEERSKLARDSQIKDTEDEMIIRDDDHTQEPQPEDVHVEVTPPTPPPPPPPPKRIVPFSFVDIVIDDPRGLKNYTLPSTDTVWYEKEHDKDGNLLDTWPPCPGHVPLGSPPSSPPSLVSRGTVVNIVISEYISSGASYDAYRGLAEVRYEGRPLVKIPIVAKYLDAEAEQSWGKDWYIKPDDYRIQNYHTEVGVLQALRRFDVAPFFYGMFENDERDDGQYLGKRWMVIEDCGTPADLSDPEVQSRVIDICELAHANGIIHNDIIARHVYSSDRQRVKLIDWGYAELLEWYGVVYDDRSFAEEAGYEILRVRKLLKEFPPRSNLVVGKGG